MEVFVISSFNDLNVFKRYNFSSDIQSELSMDSISAISLSHTSRGALCKWTALIDGELCYIKTGKLSYGKFSSLEPISEYIAYRIGELLDIDVIETMYCDVSLKDTSNFKSQDIIISYTKNFLEHDEVFYSIYKLEGDNVTYNDLVYKYSEFTEDLNKMIVFDFIINNTDRHLNNFGFIMDSNTMDIKRFCTIFDNGSSLLSDLDDNQLIELDFKDIDDYSSCKPFSRNHYSQLSLVKSLPKINLDFDREDVESIVREFSFDLSKSRITKIENLICRRLNYVRSLYSKV